MIHGVCMACIYLYLNDVRYLQCVVRMALRLIKLKPQKDEIYQTLKSINQILRLFFFKAGFVLVFDHSIWVLCFCALKGNVTPDA